MQYFMVVMLLVLTFVSAFGASDVGVTVNFDKGQSSISDDQKQKKEAAATNMIDSAKVDPKLGIGLCSGADANRFDVDHDRRNQALSVDRKDSLKCWLKELGATEDMFVSEQSDTFPYFGWDWRFASAEPISMDATEVPVDTTNLELIVLNTSLTPPDTIESEPKFEAVLEPSYMSFGIGSHSTTFGRVNFLSFRLGNGRVAMEGVYGNQAWNQHRNDAIGVNQMTGYWMVGAYFYVRPIAEKPIDFLVGFNWNAMFPKHENTTAEEFRCASLGLSSELPIWNKLSLQGRLLWEPGVHEVAKPGIRTSEARYDHYSITVGLNWTFGDR